MNATSIKTVEFRYHNELDWIIIILHACPHLQEGMQPIHFAAASDHQHIVSVLIDDYGVDPNSRSQVRNRACDSRGAGPWFQRKEGGYICRE